MPGAVEGKSRTASVAGFGGGRARERARDPALPPAAARVAEIAQIAQIEPSHAAEHIEGIGAHGIVAGIRHGCLAQPFRAAPQTFRRHHIILVLRLLDEIERKHREPWIGVGARRPHPEIARIVLHVEHGIDRILDT